MYAILRLVFSTHLSFLCDLTVPRFLILISYYTYTIKAALCFKILGIVYIFYLLCITENLKFIIYWNIFLYDCTTYLSQYMYSAYWILISSTNIFQPFKYYYIPDLIALYAKRALGIEFKSYKFLFIAIINTKFRVRALTTEFHISIVDRE